MGNGFGYNLQERDESWAVKLFSIPFIVQILAHETLYQNSGITMALRAIKKKRCKKYTAIKKRIM